MAITRLTSGDILLQLDPGITPDVSADSLKEFCVKHALHAMIYDDGKNAEDRVIHAAVGEYQVGVRSHALSKMIPTSAPLGWFVVLRLQDETLGAAFAEAARRWDPGLSAQQAKQYSQQQQFHMFKDEQNKIHLPTKFSAATERKADTGKAEDIDKLELFRSFRAYFRNQAAPVVPLSKKKGVSCNQFLSYALKVAVIATAFADGMPSEIKAKYAEIIAKKTPEMKKTSLLYAAHPDAFADFAQVVMTYLKDVSKTASLDYHQILTHRVKGHDINHFCDFVLSAKNVCQAPGIMAYLQSTDDQRIPVCLNYSSYQQLPSAVQTANQCVISPDSIESDRPAEPVRAPKGGVRR